MRVWTAAVILLTGILCHAQDNAGANHAGQHHGEQQEDTMQGMDMSGMDMPQSSPD